MSEEQPSIQISPTQSGHRDDGIMFNVVIPLSVLAVGALTFYLFGTVQPAERPPLDTSLVGRLKALTPVRVERLASLEETGAQLTLTVDGTVVPSSESRVAAEVAGRVVMKSDKCEAGQYVRKGELLMQIDRTDYDLEVQRLAQQRDLQYESILELDQEVENARRLLSIAEEDVSLMQKEADRQRSLPSGFASNADVDNADRALLAAKQQMVNTENQLALLGKRRDRLKSNERLAVINLMAAETDLKRTEIRAPIDGVIVSEEVDVNTFVNRGTTLFVIEDTRSAEVATQLRVDQLHWVLDQRLGDESSGAPADWRTRGYSLPETPAIVHYELAGLDSAVYRWKAKLLSYDGIGLDRSTRTFPVRLVVEQPQMTIGDDGRLRHDPTAPALVRGMFVQVRLLIKPSTQLVVVPSRAMQPGNRVYRFDPDQSVLEPPVSDADSTSDPARSASGEDSGADTASDSQASGDDAARSAEDDTDDFNPQQWVAGRVVVQAEVTPIDSLSLAGTASESAGDAKHWVCKVPSGTLAGGSYVVVSPIGDLTDQSLAARVHVDPNSPLASQAHRPGSSPSQPAQQSNVEPESGSNARRQSRALSGLPWSTATHQAAEPQS